jgi:hypothetical protein
VPEKCALRVVFLPGEEKPMYRGVRNAHEEQENSFPAVPDIPNNVEHEGPIIKVKRS